jgi:hypothetical protein
MRPHEDFWTYHPESETPDFDQIPAGTFAGTRKDWESLTPGMRREIVRQACRRAGEQVR